MGLIKTIPVSQIRLAGRMKWLAGEDGARVSTLLISEFRQQGNWMKSITPVRPYSLGEKVRSFIGPLY